MSRFPLLMVLLFGFGAFARPVRVTGTLRLEDRRFVVRVFAGSLNETTLVVTTTGAAALQALVDRKVTFEGELSRPIAEQRGEVVADPARVRETLPDHFRPADGDEITPL